MNCFFILIIVFSNQFDTSFRSVIDSQFILLLLQIELVIFIRIPLKYHIDSAFLVINVSDNEWNSDITRSKNQRFYNFSVTIV